MISIPEQADHEPQVLDDLFDQPSSNPEEVLLSHSVSLLFSNPLDMHALSLFLYFINACPLHLLIRGKVESTS